MPFSYANPTSGPSAGGIGWFDFGNLSLNPGSTVTGLTGTLSDGTIVTFDVSLALISGASRQFTAVTVPTFPTSNFGVTGYTGLTGNVALANVLITPPSVSLITLSNITVTNPDSSPVPNYTVILADSERTNLGEQWIWQSNGGGWQLLTTLGNSTSPTLTGLSTQTVTITGNNLVASNAYVLTTQSPTQLDLTLTNGTSSREAVSIGFATTRIRLQKNITGRIDPADQFILDIAGTPSNQVTTTGAATGIQTQIANVFSTPGSTYTISESMAPGSVSVLGDYTQVVSAGNATPAGSIPPVGNLPITFTPALGDDVTYTILNIASERFTKTVDKAFADVGDIVTYTVVVDNPNNFAVNNVLVTDATPAGTTYVGNLTVSAPFTGTDPATGITITTIAADSSVTLTWQVQVNSIPPVPNPIPNVAGVIVPGGTSGITNVVTTQVNTAFVSVLKMVDKAFANTGDILTYTLQLNNAGNVSANNVVITDIIPAGTTFIPGSLTGAAGTPPNLTLTAPIPAGGSATVTFQVQAGTTVPVPNPVSNTADAAFTYTVDPAVPNGAIGTATSNAADTRINNATLAIAKSVNKPISYLGDTLTYQLAVTNTGNVPANNVVITDAVVAGTNYVPGSLMVSVPSTGTPAAGISITNPILPGQTVTISFQAVVAEMPLPNPIVNQALAAYAYTVDPAEPNGVTANAISNDADTLVFRYNFSQQINDLIESIALEEAALAAIANSEGAKIQKMAAMGGVTTQELLCLNKSVSDMIDSIALLEAVMKQKMSAVDCQINGTC